jgi:hypothetical protein
LVIWGVALVGAHEDQHDVAEQPDDDVVDVVGLLRVEPGERRPQHTPAC